MNRFFIYEEYGAKYEMMIKDVAAAHRTMPGWSLCQKGLEVLASSLDPADSHDDHSRKALTIGDLLVKVERCPQQDERVIADPCSRSNACANIPSSSRSC